MMETRWSRNDDAIDFQRCQMLTQLLQLRTWSRNDRLLVVIPSRNYKIGKPFNGDLFANNLAIAHHGKQTAPRGGMFLNGSNPLAYDSDSGLQIVASCHIQSG